MKRLSRAVGTGLMAASVSLAASPLVLGTLTGQASVSSHSTQRSSSIYTKTVNGNGYFPGLDTQIVITAGNYIVVTASGTVWSDTSMNSSSDANGWTGGNPCLSYVGIASSTGCPNNDDLLNTLEGFIGTPPTPSPVSAKWMKLGTSRSFLASSSGNLRLIANDCNTNGCFDDNGGHFDVTITVYPSQIEVSPVAALTSPEGAAIPAGTPVATFVDHGGNANPAAYANGSTKVCYTGSDCFSGQTITYDSTSKQFTVKTAQGYVYPEEGPHAIVTTVHDGGGGGAGTADNSASPTGVTVTDRPITVATSAVSGREASAISLTGTISDGYTGAADCGDFNGTTGSGSNRGYIVVQYGDGTYDATASAPAQPGTNAGGSIDCSGSTGNFSVQSSHTYAEPGNYTTTVKAVDAGGAKDQGSSTATISDAPLTVTAAPATSTQGQAFSGKVGSFVDSSAAGREPVGEYVATIDWGDGTTSNGTLSDAGGPGYDVTGSHTYASPGSRLLTVTVTASDGATASDSTLTVTAMAVAAATTTPPTPTLPRAGNSPGPATAVVSGVVLLLLGVGTLVTARRVRARARV